MFDNDNDRRMEDRTQCDLVQVGNKAQHPSSKRAFLEMDHAQQGSRRVRVSGYRENGKFIHARSQVRRVELCRESTWRIA